MHQLDMGFAGAAGSTTTPARARAKAREADWRRQLARAFVYATGQSPGEAAELLAEYERREREGPEFMRQRPGSVIAEAPLVSLDRNERTRLVWKFRMLTRRSWVAKDTGKHRGVITRTAESVFGALLSLSEKYGRVFPSLEGLAHLAMCCKQSVVTALADLERLGFLTRIRRIRQIMTPLGFTTRQITNAYRVHEPTSGLGLLAMCVFATESNSWTASEPSAPEAGKQERRMRKRTAFHLAHSNGGHVATPSWLPVTICHGPNCVVRACAVPIVRSSVAIPVRSSFFILPSDHDTVSLPQDYSSWHECKRLAGELASAVAGRCPRRPSEHQ
jgi:hypothetical protein